MPGFSWPAEPLMATLTGPSCTYQKILKKKTRKSVLYCGAHHVCCARVPRPTFNRQRRLALGICLFDINRTPKAMVNRDILQTDGETNRFLSEFHLFNKIIGHCSIGNAEYVFYFILVRLPDKKYLMHCIEIFISTTKTTVCYSVKLGWSRKWLFLITRNS
jgi:hypothetical protein